MSTTSPVYYVDPVHGSDTGTGTLTLSDGGASTSCALKTITRALQIIGNAVVPTQIVVVGGGSATVGAGETFPIAVPANVTLSTQGGAVTVNVPGGQTGFTMTAPNATITSGSGALLTITSSGTPGGAIGIVVGTNSAATTEISNVAVTGLTEDGILVKGSGVVTLGAGVNASNNGTSTKGGNGLSVQDSGEAIITVASGAAPTTFDDNTAHGILVQDTGSIRVTGSATSATAGNVETNGNALAGVWIQQTANGASTPPQNVINGLVSFANSGGNGMRIVAGSNVQVRNSSFVGNGGNGVILSSGGTTAAPVNSLAHIDLGSSGSNGGNTFQAALGAGNNGGVGLCVSLKGAGSTGQTLSAVGDIFHAANCATTAATLTLNANACANSAKACAGGVCDLGQTATGTTFDVSTCAP